MSRLEKRWSCCPHCLHSGLWPKNGYHVRCRLCWPGDQQMYVARLPQAKDIPDEAIYQAIREVKAERSGYMTSRWDIEKKLSQYPPKVVMAKLRTLVKKRKTIDGCTCGCRGDFEFVVPTDFQRLEMTIAAIMLAPIF
jgi:hypothetical protein